MKVLVIIPTKLDSTRLEKKNIRELNGKPMFLHSVDYANQSKHEVTILVSSESAEVKSICEQYGVRFDLRKAELCGDTEVVDVYLDVVNKTLHDYDLVVGLQPDNPNRSHALDECIDYMIENKYYDLITVNPNYKRSGSVRIFKYEYLKSGQVSKRLGCIKDNAVDVHYESDLELAKNNVINGKL
jgi:CMP-N-acetylneuraminic acid synthetase